MLTKVLDQIFWKRFADELHSDPQAPAMACFAGMFQVGLIFFLVFIALLVPVSRLAIIGLRAIVGMGDFKVGNVDARYIGIAAVSALLSAYLVKRRYWHYRLTPEDAAPYYEGIDRGMMVFTVVGLLAAAFGLMALMFKLFW